MLGAIQGPAEFLPISSSGHVALVPAILDWPYVSMHATLRKAFEVALHAGAVAGMLLTLRREIVESARALGRPGAIRLAITSAPAVTAAAVLRNPIEARLGSARSVALAQVVAGACLCAADLRAPRRGLTSATHGDALAVGLAQATALVPGVSRTGATLTAARALAFDRPSSGTISRQAALPVVVGAAAFEGGRLARDGLPSDLRRAFAAGVAAALASTVAARRLAETVDRVGSYAPFGAYRVSLGVLALVLTRRRAARGRTRAASDSMAR